MNSHWHFLFFQKEWIDIKILRQQLLVGRKWRFSPLFGQKNHGIRGSTFALTDVCYDSTFRQELKGDDDDFVHSKAIQKITAHLQFFKS